MVALRRLSFLFLVSVVLVACGGGGKSSSGSGPAVYRGTETVTISSPSVPAFPPQTATFPLTIEVRGRAVRIVDTDGTVYTGTLIGSSFEATGAVPLGNVGNGIACGTVNLVYSGTIAGNGITGNSVGRFPCTREGRTLQFLIQGNFTVSRGKAREVRATDSLRGLIGRTLRNL